MTRHVTCALLAAVLLTGCGGGGGGSAEEPRPTPTRSVDLPSPTRSTEPTDDAEPPTPDRTRDTAEPRPERPTRETSPRPTTTTTTTSTATATATSTATSTDSTSTSTTSSSTTSTTADEAGGPPTWVWWLLGAILVALLAGGIAAWLRSRRRHQWLADLADVEEEVRWFAHELLAELRRSASLDQVVGGWNIASARVGATEDRLTVLESSAPSEADGARVRTLRDAVRLAAHRLDSLTVVAPHDTWALDLDEVAADLEVVLAPAAATGRPGEE